jgi:electron transport complex protein RnfB
MSTVAIAASALVARIDAELPQTQCTKCGHAGCRPYAEAIAVGTAQINQCPPGGAAGIATLAAVTGRPVLPLNPANGVEKPLTVAVIDEALCIGCTLCIQACPTDAIVGAAKQMHTVLLDACTGCELCVPPCPVDCIEIVALAEAVERGAQALREQIDVPVVAHAMRWRERFTARGLRLERERQERDQRLAAKAEEKLKLLDAMADDPQRDRKRAAVQAAIERARARRAPG